MASILHRGTGQYRVQIRRNGTSLCKTFETRREAEEWGRVMEGRITGGERIERRSSVTLAQACEWMKGHIPDTPDKQNAYPHYRYWGQSKFAGWALDAIHPWSLKEWVDEVSGKEFSAQTAIHRLNALSKLYQLWSMAHRVALENPVKPGIRPGKPDGRDRRLRDGEEARLLDAADRTSRPWLRHAIIIALETALRQSEQHGLEWPDINLEQGYLDLSKTKNDRPRRVPLSGRAIEAFRALRHYHRPAPVETRNGIVLAFQDARAIAGSDDLRWHDLRHESISRLFERTDFRDMEIMAISGHLSPSMLVRYSHLRTGKLTDRLPGGKLNPQTRTR